MRPEDVIGAWSLASFTITGPDGRVKHPYGADGRGLLVYTADGWVSATLAFADRPFERLPPGAAPTDAERLRAIDTYTAYAGRYRIDGDRVLHDVELSLKPWMLGDTVERRARLDGGDLLLSFEVEGRAGAYAYELRWRRPR